MYPPFVLSPYPPLVPSPFGVPLPPLGVPLPPLFPLSPFSPFAGWMLFYRDPSDTHPSRTESRSMVHQRGLRGAWRLSVKPSILGEWWSIVVGKLLYSVK